MEAITYLVSQENAVSCEAFYKIFSTRGVATKVMRVLDNDTESRVGMDEMMSFVMAITMGQGSKLSHEAVERLKKVFSEHISKDKHEIDFQEFKNIVPAKNEFFVRRIFNIFDNDRSGTITLTKFIETVQQFAKDDDDAKIEFLFQVYDTDQDGVLQEDNFREVLKACMTENGMEFEEEEVDHLASVLFMDGCKDGADHMTLDDFKEQLQRQEGLVKNMGIMITKWLVPLPAPAKKRAIRDRCKDVIPPEMSTKDYWTNNKRLWVLIIFLINLVIMGERVYYYSSFAMLSGYIPNFFYLTSRACGKALLFNSVLILVLVLRKSITALTRFGFSKILPLDNNIYLHKVVGTIIFVQSFTHTVAHLCNFAVNVQPNPARFIQLTYNYWVEHYGVENYPDLWELLGTTVYHLPEGCELISETDPRQETLCPEDSFPSPEHRQGWGAYNETMGGRPWMCQACPADGRGPWTYGEWIFTSQPHIFGLMPGMANPAGVALIVSLTVMFVCSLPFIRRRGHFEIFYFTHLLYWAYFALLVMHAPAYWMWLIVPGLIWVAEMSYRVINVLFGAGKTVIKAGVILPSNVTNLIIERPPGFNFSAGDWVFIKIPAVASSEWHPFTISSAPEVAGQFTLHVRGVGQWTNSLHQLFKAEHERQTAGYARQESAVSKIQGTVRRKYKSVKVFVDKRIVSGGEGEVDEENFVGHLKQKTLEERKHERMEKRQERLRRQQTSDNTQMDPISRRTLASVRYLSMRQPKIVKYDSSNSLISDEQEDHHLDIVTVHDPKHQAKAGLKATRLEKPLEVYVDGPFGSPSSNIYRAEHAVLVGTGIGVTPFASILQSIMHRYMEIKQSCPSCAYSWTNNMEASMFNLKKVDFIWINRDQKSFEWFVNLLSQLEIEQQEHGGEMSRFLEMHMYVTSALQRTDMKAVALQMALDILHQKESRDLVTGLKARTNAGRPNWNKVFTKLREEKKGQVTVFYCGNPALARTLKAKSAEFGFKFRKEIF